MKVYERLTEAFVAEGTRTVFGMIGDGNMRGAVQQWVAHPSPTVIDARISQKVLTIQFRRMYFGQGI